MWTGAADRLPHWSSCAAAAWRRRCWRKHFLPPLHSSQAAVQPLQTRGAAPTLPVTGQTQTERSESNRPLIHAPSIPVPYTTLPPTCYQLESVSQHVREEQGLPSIAYLNLCWAETSMTCGTICCGGSSNRLLGQVSSSHPPPRHTARSPGLMQRSCAAGSWTNIVVSLILPLTEYFRQ